MDLQCNMESELRDTLATKVNGWVNPMICMYMLSPPLTAANKGQPVGQYIMFEQADHSILVGF